MWFFISCFSYYHSVHLWLCISLNFCFIFELLWLRCACCMSFMVFIFTCHVHTIYTIHPSWYYPQTSTIIILEKGFFKIKYPSYLLCAPIQSTRREQSKYKQRLKHQCICIQECSRGLFSIPYLFSGCILFSSWNLSLYSIYKHSHACTCIYWIKWNQ